MIYQIQSNDEYVDIIKNLGEKLLVIDFMANWCMPCKKLSRPLEELSNKYPKVVFIKIDVDEFEELASLYNVTAMPTIVFGKSNKILEQFSGADINKIESVVQKYI
jgi:thioredoxin 1